MATTDATLPYGAQGLRYTIETNADTTEEADTPLAPFRIQVIEGTDVVFEKEMRNSGTVVSVHAHWLDWQKKPRKRVTSLQNLPPSQNRYFWYVFEYEAWAPSRDEERIEPDDYSPHQTYAGPGLFISIRRVRRNPFSARASRA